MQPIHTRGNWFWKGDDRFLIKGINYSRRHAEEPGRKPARDDAFVDVLAEENIKLLEHDIHLLTKLGLNTVLVSNLKHNKSHGQALDLLAAAGMYVIAMLQVHATQREELMSGHGGPTDKERDVQHLYSTERLTNTMRIVDELADHSNISGFIVDGGSLNTAAATCRAEVLRAGVRDIKAFLRQRRGRITPVGVSQPDALMIRDSALQFFTAGDAEDRIDFWALECWSWVSPSSFQISGWKNMVSQLEAYPVPMLLSEYGAKVGRERSWQEIDCLFSPDMTGVFSGGCAYTFHETGNRYGIVEIREDGSIGPKVEKDEDGNVQSNEANEFEALKKRMQNVNRQTFEQTFGSKEMRNYESWTGAYPERKQNRWNASSDRMPPLPVDWNELMQRVRRETEHQMAIKGNANADSLAAAIVEVQIRERGERKQ